MSHHTFKFAGKKLPEQAPGLNDEYDIYMTINGLAIRAGRIFLG